MPRDVLSFQRFFAYGSSAYGPMTSRVAYPFQARLATGSWPATLIIPTGFGKTAAVLAAWLWKRAHADCDTPSRLIYCLPMRTLVDQTAGVARVWAKAAQSYFALNAARAANVHVLMGGADATGPNRIPDWIMNPDCPAILVGTQDMLVSGALLRSYGTTRFRWPVDFALLNTDALWVMDEVQLAGAALPTSAQMEAFRRERSTPSRTLWMSATLDPAWLRTPDFEPSEPSRPHDLTSADLAAAPELWNAVKRIRRAAITPGDLAKDGAAQAYAQAVAALARKQLQQGRSVLVFLNTVRRAQQIRDALQDCAPLLLHSRFRAADRADVMRQVLEDTPPQGRIIVTTQALEAGVDITSSVTITELAPWSAMVQRIGRCNRYGECRDAGGDVFWINLPETEAAPYSPGDLAKSRAQLERMESCGPEVLSGISLSQPTPTAIIRRRDLLDLFDTEPDLSGFDVDVSPYVRDADDTDLRLFWRDIEAGADPRPDLPAASADELCPAPVSGARTLLKGRVRAWCWDPLGKAWRKIVADDLRPGLEIMLDAASGGYAVERGFDPSFSGRVEPVPIPPTSPPPAGGDDEPDSRGAPVTLADHTRHVVVALEQLCDGCRVTAAEREALLTAALWHDVGKAHRSFQLMLGADSGSAAGPLAKSDKMKTSVWASVPHEFRRPRFRHELVSALAYLAAQEWRRDADLSAYLIAAHHGKLRMRLRALPGERTPPDDRLFARGVWDGDHLPAVSLPGLEVASTVLDLDIMRLGEGEHGASWAARTQALLEEHGPFRLAWLEALLRIADWRASAAEGRGDGGV
ncbi:MAG: CRISPR-associated endonuclease Cas3'' [Acetobacteraceae bacterium]|nr:CRISPR-associated endonuclease Cas3'' [Acetobacteraceae bacterium]